MRLIGVASIALVLALTFTSASAREDNHQRFDGQEIFRFDTFGDEQLWTNVLRLHEGVQDVSPATALSVGLKVDVDALPPGIIAALKADQVDLDDPAVTIALLKLNAVVGVVGTVNDAAQLTSIGITCASKALSFGVTRSGVWLMKMPIRGSLKLPWPPIWLTPT